MPATSSTSSTKRGAARNRRKPRAVNRSNQRAMNVRRSETIPSKGTTVAPTADTATGGERAARVGRGPAAIPRGLEMLYIRHDLRRMIFTAAALLVVMLVLLVIFSAFV